MKLNELIKPGELTQFRNNPGTSETWHKVAAEFMANHGFKRVGKGSYGSVFIHPSKPFALKVFRNDPEYLRWIKFCNGNRGNPYVPVFRGNPINVTDDIYSIRMEILEPVKNAFPAYILSAFVSFYKEIFVGSDNPHDQDNVELVRGMNPEQFFPNYLEDKHLKTVLEFLYQHRNTVDIRQENIMTRGSQIVITDPLAP